MGTQNVIHELEVLPVTVCRLIWPHMFRDRDVLAFVDNDAATSTLINGYSQNAMACRMASIITESDIELNTRVWCDRVPSSSNLADDPSRGKDAAPLAGWSAPHRSPALEALGVIRTACVLG